MNPPEFKIGGAQHLVLKKNFLSLLDFEGYFISM